MAGLKYLGSRELTYKLAFLASSTQVGLLPPFSALHDNYTLHVLTTWDFDPAKHRLTLNPEGHVASSTRTSVLDVPLHGPRGF